MEQSEDLGLAFFGNGIVMLGIVSMTVVLSHQAHLFFIHYTTIWDLDICHSITCHNRIEVEQL